MYESSTIINEEFIEISMKPFDLNKLTSSSLKTLLKTTNIRVMRTNGEEYRKKSPRKSVIACMASPMKMMIVFEDDVKRAGITDKELTCILFHEFAHYYLKTNDEKKV